MFKDSLNACRTISFEGTTDAPYLRQVTPKFRVSLEAESKSNPLIWTVGLPIKRSFIACSELSTTTCESFILISNSSATDLTSSIVGGAASQPFIDRTLTFITLSPHIA